jgi:hypothetical protein
MAITPITITGGPINNPDGTPASGSFTFQLVLAGVATGMANGTELVSPTTLVAVVYNGQLLTPPIGGGGYEPVELLANDDPGTTPTGTQYLVTEALSSGVNIDPWLLTVYHSSVGGTLDISSQRPTP